MGLWLALVCLLPLACDAEPDGRPAPASAAPSPAPGVPGFDTARYIAVDEVRPGMQGYGMTVFHGVEPEPFAVEVVSVERGSSPGKSVVWVRCPDRRMQLTGPVQGMSGSPIYLWTRGKGTPGRGGRMLGAFAFGYRLGKDCYVGVQPIQHMLEAAARTPAQAQPDADAAQAADTNRTFDGLFETARRMGLDEQQTWRLRAAADVMGHDVRTPRSPIAAAPDSRRLRLPLRIAGDIPPDMLAPMVEPLGLSVTAAADTAPRPALAPRWIDAEKAEMKPGSAFAIPLTFGPMDMSVLGTATEVLPDGRVLAFGHQFFAQGPIQVPMAVGFVHYIQPSIQSSFKLGGSLRVTGAVLRDEATAVVGVPGAAFETLPANITVRWPEPSQRRSFDYRVVHHRRLLPMLAGSAVAASITTDTSLPTRSSLRLRGTLQFSNGRDLKIDRLMPQAAERQLMFSLVQAMGPVLNNPFENVKATSIDAEVEVVDEVLEAPIVEAALDQPEIEPGQTLLVHVTLRPFMGEPVRHQLTLPVPSDLPEGRYQLVVGGAQAYSQQISNLRPHLMRASNVKEMFDALDFINGIRDDALYAVLRLPPTTDLAIGRTELPKLPSSKLALLRVETSTRTTPYAGSVETSVPVGHLVSNQVTIAVQVRAPSTP